MNTRVNRQTWTSVGNSAATTANGVCSTVSSTVRATPTPPIASRAALVSAASTAQTRNAAQITTPYQNGLARNIIPSASSARARPRPRCGRKYLRSCSQEISVR